VSLRPLPSPATQDGSPKHATGRAVPVTEPRAEFESRNLRLLCSARRYFGEGGGEFTMIENRRRPWRTSAREDLNEDCDRF